LINITAVAPSSYTDDPPANSPSGPICGRGNLPGTKQSLINIAAVDDGQNQNRDGITVKKMAIPELEHVRFFRRGASAKVMVELTKNCHDLFVSIVQMPLPESDTAPKPPRAAASGHRAPYP
jgi:hypothetical protein